jgi:HK97 gp10 family phage protein
MTGYQLKGFDEVLLKLDAYKRIVGDKSAKTPVSKALRKGAASIAKRVRVKARALDRRPTPNKIYKNVRTYVIKKPQRFNADVGYRVGILGGAKRPARAVGEFKGKGSANPGGDTYYWRYLEFGTRRARPRPFMRPAMHEGAQEAFDTFVEALDEFVGKVAKGIAA